MIYFLNNNKMRGKRRDYEQRKKFFANLFSPHLNGYNFEWKFGRTGTRMRAKYFESLLE